jgi:hypothetical protein
MKTELIVSCPHCRKETSVFMEQRNDEFRNIIDTFLTSMAPDIKGYSFDGEAQCPCGKRLTATLTVSCRSSGDGRAFPGRGGTGG